MPIRPSDFERAPDQAPAARSAAFDPERPFLFEGLTPRFATRVVRSVFVPMRDGVRLSTDFHIPLGAPERLPVVLSRTPYGKAGSNPALRALLAEQGFVFAVQDVRGRHESEGAFAAASGQDRDDGYDTVEWLVSQPWCNGAVGACGISYGGETAAKLAAARHPAHRCGVLMFDGAYAGGESQNGAFLQSGMLLLEALFEWCRNAVPTISYGPPPHVDREAWFSQAFARFYATQPNLPPIDLAAALRVLPVVEMMVRAGDGVPSPFEDFVRRSADPADPYWSAQGFLDERDAFHTPTLHMTGPRERGGSGPDNFRLFRANGVDERTRANQHLWFTPALHGLINRCSADDRQGARSLGDTREPYYQVMLAWFDHWLRDGPAPQLAPVRYYLLGANRWCEATDWPPPGTCERRLYLSGEGSDGGGALSWTAAEAPDAHSYVYDPADPTPSGEPDAPYVFLGSFGDRTAIERRRDVVSFTSPPLERPLRLVGPLRVELHVSSDAPDTDVVALLTEVDAEGRSIDIMHGATRMRFREGRTAAPPMQAGEVYPVTIDLWHAAIEIAPGRRLRLTITSSFFPYYARALNTAGDPFCEAQTRAARNAVHHGGACPSALVLTVLDEP